MPEWVRFQKWVSNELNKIGLKAHVNGQAQGGLGIPDVEAHPFGIECKSYETLSSDTIIKAVRQAQFDSVKCDKYPVAICRNSKGDIIVSMDFKQFKDLVEEFILKK